MKNQFTDEKCEILTKHFGIGFSRNANYVINHVNITNILSGSGRDSNGIPIPQAAVERQEKETKWTFSFQAVYLYGLNDKVGEDYMAEKK